MGIHTCGYVVHYLISSNVSLLFFNCCMCLCESMNKSDATEKELDLRNKNCFVFSLMIKLKKGIVN